VGIVAFVLFMIPCGWLAARVVRTRELPDAANLGVLFGAGVYFVMWFAVGRIEEVRIFLPYAVALIPLTVEYAMRGFAQPERSGTDETRMVNSRIS